VLEKEYQTFPRTGLTRTGTAQVEVYLTRWQFCPRRRAAAGSLEHRRARTAGLSCHRGWRWRWLARLLSHCEQEEERGDARDAYKCTANARATLCGGRESQLNSGSCYSYISICGCGCKCDRWVAYGARADCQPKPVRGEGIKREAGREDGGRLDKERVVRVGEALCACVGDGVARSRPGGGAARQRRSDVANVFGVSVNTFRSACLLRGRVE